MWDSINTDYKWSGEIWNRRKNGELFLEWITINAVFNSQGEITHYFSVFADITERKTAEEAVRKLTFYDGLTNLPNRRLFLDRLEQAIKKAERNNEILAVLFLDLDNFKDVNDTLGHKAGDQLLQQAARRLAECIRDSDTVARMGGDDTITYLGRGDDLMNAGGYRVSPQEVEACLLRCPGIVDAGVAEVEVRPGVKVISAFYVPETASLPDAVLEAHCAGLLARYKCPRAFHAMDALPRGSNGKLRRRELGETQDRT